MDRSAEAKMMKMMVMGMMTEAPPSLKALFEQARLDLKLLLSEYVAQGDGKESVAAFLLALPVFMADLDKDLPEMIKGRQAQEKPSEPEPKLN